MPDITVVIWAVCGYIFVACMFSGIAFDIFKDDYRKHWWLRLGVFLLWPALLVLLIGLGLFGLGHLIITGRMWQ